MKEEASAPISKASEESAKYQLGNVLVTGGLGFIGSHFIRHILTSGVNSSGNSVINVDYCGYGSNPNNVKDIHDNPNYRHVNADINNQELLANIFQNHRIDIIINFAAETHVDRSIIDPKNFVHSNVDGTFSLLELCRKYDTPRFIQISTDEVYGDATGQEGITEQHQLEPSSPYSASKASADLLVSAYHRTYELDTSITRCSNNFGPNQFPEKLLPKTIIRALKGLAVPIYGDGNQSREWIYVRDHVNGIVTVAKHGKPGNIYNISSSIELTNMEIVKKISDILFRKRGIDVKIEHVTDRPGHDRRYALDSTKIRKELDWQPSSDKTIDYALQETVTWYLDNEWWWKPLVDGDYSVLHPQPWTVMAKKSQ